MKILLLDPRFRVIGFRPGGYDPEEIPRPILEHLRPDIVLSELIETVVIEPRRRYERVRVFDLWPEIKTPGRKAVYDWPTLKGKIERERPNIFSMAELVEHCRNQVTTVSGKPASKNGPDDKTVRGAIDKYGLRKFIKLKVRD